MVINHLPVMGPDPPSKATISRVTSPASSQESSQPALPPLPPVSKTAQVPMPEKVQHWGWTLALVSTMGPPSNLHFWWALW